MYKRMAVMFFVLVLMSMPALAADNPAIEGVYENVPGHTLSFDGKEVEIIEFLNFYCGHCYSFEKDIPVIKGNFPKKIRWKTVPLYWGKSAKAVEAFFLAEEAGKGEEMKQAIFKAHFVDKRDISLMNVLESLAVELGLGFDFSRRLRAGEKAKDVGEALLLSQSYKIDATPTLIIAGNLKAVSGASGNGPNAFRNNVITIVRSLFKK